LWKINYVAMRSPLQLAALTSNRQIFASTARDRIPQRPDLRLNGFSEAGDHLSVDQISLGVLAQRLSTLLWSARDDLQG
jgi:hypothetical protein